MSFASDLKKVLTLDEAQELFENEILRLSTLDVYRSSKKRYYNRINKVQNDVYDHLNRIGVSGILYLCDDLLINHDEMVVDAIDTSEEYDRDVKFFKWLYFGVFLWCIMMLVLGKLLNVHGGSESQRFDSNVDVQTEVVTEQSSDDTIDDIVWNEYRQIYTDQETLNIDQSWVDQSVG